MEFILFKEYLKKFLIYLDEEKKLSLHSIKSYSSDLDQLCTFWDKFQEKKSLTFSTEKILPYYERWLLSQKFSSSSIARKSSCLASLKKFFEKEKIKVHIDMPRPFVPKKSPIFLQMQKLIQLFDKISDEELPTKRPYRDRAIIELLYATGMRCSEIAALTIRDIDLKEKIIFVKGSKQRLVLFGAKAQEKLIAYIQYERGNNVDLSAPLWISFRNTPLTVRSIQRICLMFGQVLDEKRKITPALLRNSFATHLLSKGADPAIVQQLLGYTTHVSIEKHNKNNNKK